MQNSNGTAAVGERHHWMLLDFPRVLHSRSFFPFFAFHNCWRFRFPPGVLMDGNIQQVVSVVVVAAASSAA